MSDLSRRDLLKAAALATAGIATAGPFSSAIAEHITAGSHPDLAPPAPPNRKSMRAVPFAKHDVVRVGMVGTGLRGRSVLTELLGVDNVKIVALCDVVPDKARMRREDGDRQGPGRARALHDWRSCLRAARRARRPRSRLHRDAVGMARAGDARRARARQARRGSECPIGTTLKDLWALVDASERAQKHCMQLENCNYGYNEMLVNRMVHDGLFGEVLHAEAAYLHDLREILFEIEGRGTLAPRLAHALQLQPLSDPRARPRELVSRRPRRRPLRLHRRRRDAGARTVALSRGDGATRPTRAGASATSPATSIRRSSRR